MHRRSPRAFASSWLRSLTLSSFAFGGLLLAAPAHAAETREAPVSIVDVSMQDGELTARLRWSTDSKSLPGEVEVLSYNGEDKLTAGERMTPKAGQEMEVKLYGAVEAPWETGWAQRLVVREAKGRDLASLPYDVNLACEDEKTCALTATAGISATREVLHVSDALQRTLAGIEKEMGEKEFDLVHEVARREPSLFGEALSYAHGLVKVSPAAGCDCVWETSSSRTNTSGTTLGAAHDLHARPFSSTRPGSARLTSQGTSRITLNLRCGTLSSPRLQPVGIKQSGGLVKSVLLPQPVYSTCVGPCSGRFTHFGKLMGRVTANNTSGMLPNGTATEQAMYHLGNALSPILNEAHSAPADTTFFANSPPGLVGGGTSYVQTSGEAYYFYNPNSTPWQPFGRAQNGYAMAIQGNVVCPVPNNTLYPIGRAWDIATTFDNEEVLSSEVWEFFGL